MSLSRWLFVVAALVFAMVVVGGITRLTESGLSITEWKPISGAIPPLTHADWERAFALYKQALVLVRTYKPLTELDQHLAAGKLYLYEHARHVISEYETHYADDLAQRGLVPQGVDLGIS